VDEESGIVGSGPGLCRVPSAPTILSGEILALPGSGPGPRCATYPVAGSILPTLRRYRGSAPALVARGWPSSSTARGSTDVAGVPRPSLRAPEGHRSASGLQELLSGPWPRPLLCDPLACCPQTRRIWLLPGWARPSLSVGSHYRLRTAPRPTLPGFDPALVARGRSVSLTALWSRRCRVRPLAPALVARRTGSTRRATLSPCVVGGWPRPSLCDR
jgi:hypothetical protein